MCVRNYLSTLLFTLLLVVQMSGCRVIEDDPDVTVRNSAPVQTFTTDQDSSGTVVAMQSDEKVQDLFDELRQYETNLRATEETILNLSSELEAQKDAMSMREHRLRSQERLLLAREAENEAGSTRLKAYTWLAGSVFFVGLIMLCAGIILVKKARSQNAAKEPTSLDQTAKGRKTAAKAVAKNGD